MKDFLKTQFRENSLNISIDYDFKMNENLIVVVSDDRDENYTVYGVFNKELKENQYAVALFIRSYDGKSFFTHYSDKFFKYKINIISQIDDVLSNITEINFDPKYHKFFLRLKSNDQNEIEIWKNYIKLLESISNIKIEYSINSNTNILDNFDTIEISKESYEKYIRQSNRPVTDDYSSLTIIKTLFNI